MPRTCSICAHPKRPEIDAALVRPDSLRVIAGRFGTSKSSLERHRDKCVSDLLAKAKDISDVAAASHLVDELLKLTKKTGEVLTRAVREKNGDLALKAIARLERQLELKARLLGKLEERADSQTTVQVIYVDAMPGKKFLSGTRDFHQSLGSANAIDMKTHAEATCNPLLIPQNRDSGRTDQDENVLGAPQRNGARESN
jgi:hypothetical protein